MQHPEELLSTPYSRVCDVILPDQDIIALVSSQYNVAAEQADPAEPLAPLDKVIAHYTRKSPYMLRPERSDFFWDDLGSHRLQCPYFRDTDFHAISRSKTSVEFSQAMKIGQLYFSLNAARGINKTEIFYVNEDAEPFSDEELIPLLRLQIPSSNFSLIQPTLILPDDAKMLTHRKIMPVNMSLTPSQKQADFKVCCTEKSLRVEEAAADIAEVLCTAIQEKWSCSRIQAALFFPKFRYLIGHTQLTQPSENADKMIDTFLEEMRREASRNQSTFAVNEYYETDRALAALQDMEESRNLPFGEVPLPNLILNCFSLEDTRIISLGLGTDPRAPQVTTEETASLSSARTSLFSASSSNCPLGTSLSITSLELS